MRHFVLAGIFFAASACWAQNAIPNAQQQPTQVQAQAPATAQKQTITIAAGTVIPMTLASPITNKTQKPGNAVRAITASAVTVDTQLMIPAGTYVEGVIDKVNMHGPTGPILQMHFTRILFNNGYTVTFDGKNAVAQKVSPRDISPEYPVFPDESLPGHTPFASESALAYSHAVAAQQGPTPPALPPLHNPGPNIGVVVGASLGATAAIIAGIFIASRHSGGTSNVLFDVGWRFQMVLQGPLTLDAASVAAAIASPSAE